jgi:AraC family transcriptional regulator
MSPAEKALWYIEGHFAGTLCLDDVAQAAGVSRYHLVRAFASLTGRSVMRYVRARRLSEAARRLAEGAPDILTVALEAGYGSHEAFTRAFRDQFGLPPESVRAQRRIDVLDLVEPNLIDYTPVSTLEPPRFEQGHSLLIAGLGKRYPIENSSGIPAQWQPFLPYLENGPEQVRSVAYGVSHNFSDDDHFDYIAGMAIADTASLPADFTSLRIPKHRYAVFNHRDHISLCYRLKHTIWNEWLPTSGLQVASAPFFERYDEHFDTATGMGVVELWIPISD